MMVITTIEPPLVLRAKLAPPPVPRDLIPRSRLYDRLEDGADGPVTLVVGPAGFGKSTLVASWLEGNVRPSAWLTLDEDDSDLASFLQYLVSAVRTLHPDACPGLLSKDEGQSAGSLGKRLANDLDAISTPFTLVLDGYGAIRAPAVHELVGTLTRYPPRRMHLVLISRYDPPMPAARLRAEGRLTEIRQEDLRFTKAETAEFFQQTLGASPLPNRLSRRGGRMEGWPAGLRLLAQSVCGRDLGGTTATSAKWRVRDAELFLGAEVISQETAKMRETLVRCSILDSFCAPLCEAIAGRVAPARSGKGFLAQLRDRNLFLVPDGERRGWFRFHRFFRDMLRDTLSRELPAGEAAKLHDRASEWFEAEGDLPEAVRHAIHGSDPACATRILVRHRTELMNEDRWSELDRCLRLLPRELVEGEIEAVLLRAWLAPPALLPASLKTVEALLANGGEELDGLRGEFDALRARVHYQSGDGKRAVRHAKRALKRIPSEARMARANAWGILALGFQMSGEEADALEAIEGGWGEQTREGGAPLASILLARCRLHWADADLVSMGEWATRCVKLSERARLPRSLDLARSALALTRYHRNELDEAVAAMPSGREFNGIEGAVTRALVLQAVGSADESNTEASRLLDRCLGDPDPRKLGIVRALQAELAFQQGRREDALRLARGADRDLRSCEECGVQPAVTRAKLLIASGVAEDREEAEGLLEELIGDAENLHKKSTLIHLHALMALLANSRGKDKAARASLTASLDLARPGGFRRLFVDLGSEMADLLARFAPPPRLQDFVAEIRSAFRTGVAPEAEGEAGGFRATLERQSIPSPLTNRELEILELLARRLSNKEIGAKLYISTETVKKHAINIYQKLHVSGRQNAVARAVSLGILIR